MSAIYVATFHGDIGELHPIAAHTLEDCLKQIQECHGFGKSRQSLMYPDEMDRILPDIEDDKIEVWKFDPDAACTAEIVCGFWGWHWQKPNNPGCTYMVLPNCDGKSLQELASEDY